MNNKLMNGIKYSHSLLKEYIEIHEQIFNSPKGIFGKLKKIFVPMDFGKYVTELEIIKLMLTEHNHQVYYYELSENHTDFFGGKSDEFILKDLLSLYNRSLIRTLNCLLKICLKLQKKSITGSYPISEYKSDLKLYNESVDLYKLVGTDLNKYYYQVFFSD